MKYYELRNVACWLILIARYLLPRGDVDWGCRCGWIKDFLDLRKTATRLDRPKNNGKAKLSSACWICSSGLKTVFVLTHEIGFTVYSASALILCHIVPDYNLHIVEPTKDPCSSYHAYQVTNVRSRTFKQESGCTLGDQTQHHFSPSPPIFFPSLQWQLLTKTRSRPNRAPSWNSLLSFQ